MRLFDVILAGASGQIGRALLPELEQSHSVFVVDRETDLERLPPARHVVNAAGYTKFDDDVERLWHDNVRFAVDLATAAKSMNAHFHQLSSEAVAEFRQDELPEKLYGGFGYPTAHPAMNDYALSKVLVEQAVRSILPPSALSVYRCSDVIPARDTFDQHWRRNHWLSIMFAAGRAAFWPCDNFPVWIATTQELAQALALLIKDGSPGAYHLLGHVYTWEQFWEAARPTVPERGQRFVPVVRRIVRIDPPLATCIDQTQTVAKLRELGFKWTRLGMDYWKEFAAYAAK